MKKMNKNKIVRIKASYIHKNVFNLDYNFDNLDSLFDEKYKEIGIKPLHTSNITFGGYLKFEVVNEHLFMLGLIKYDLDIKFQ